MTIRIALSARPLSRLLPRLSVRIARITPIAAMAFALFGAAKPATATEVFGSLPITGGAGLAEPVAVKPAWPPGLIDADGLRRKFDSLDYDLDLVRRGDLNVPRVFVSVLPGDLKTLRSTVARKQLFIQMILPLILRANERVLADRRRLLAIDRQVADGHSVLASDELFLISLAKAYGLENPDLVELKRRVDFVPPSLALAQAAEESGWGTSRFAIRGNAVFGQHTFTRGAGMVPRRRDAGKRHEVKVFDGLYHSVASYLRNLNTHPAYEDFRALRAGKRALGQPLNGYTLVAALQRYSERGSDYIRSIRDIMRVNRMWNFDSVQLIPVEPDPRAPISPLEIDS